MSHVQGTGKGRRDGEKLQRAFPLRQPSAKGPSFHILCPHPPCPKEVLERGYPHLAAHCWKQGWWHHGPCGTMGSLAPMPNRHALACHLPTLSSVPCCAAVQSSLSILSHQVLAPDSQLCSDWVNHPGRNPLLCSYRCCLLWLHCEDVTALLECIWSHCIYP